jgi:molybdopterin-containing oxidoreductase family iron-sulfur binding subunit
MGKDPAKSKKPRGKAKLLDGKCIVCGARCQQVCPTRAIVFGDLNAHQGENPVARMHRDRRRYDLLHELNTRPRTGYLARVKNLDPELETAQTPRPQNGRVD